MRIVTFHPHLLRGNGHLCYQCYLLEINSLRVTRHRVNYAKRREIELKRSCQCILRIFHQTYNLNIHRAILRNGRALPKSLGEALPFFGAHPFLNESIDLSTNLVLNTWRKHTIGTAFVKSNKIAKADHLRRTQSDVIKTIF